jgi:hypothetical protein
MGIPVVFTASGGLPVAVAANGIGVPMTLATTGTPVTMTDRGMPAVIPGLEPFGLGDSLLAWWDASYGVTVTGAGVSSWLDRVHQYDVVQTTDAARPAYSATGFNGAPGLTFDGTDDRLTLNSMPFPANNFEVWAVIQNDALAATAGNKFIVNLGTGVGAVQNRRFTNNTMASVIAGSAVVAEQTGPFESRHLFHSTFTPTANTVSIDGAAATSAANTVNATGVRCRIGSNTADTAAAFWHGKMRDVMVTRLLTTAQSTALQTFLLARRAL